MHYGKDKTKSIFFSKEKGLKEMNKSFAGHSIKQHKTVEYLDCQLDSKLTGEAIVSKILKKIHARLKFLYRQSRYLTPAFSHISIMDVPHAFFF